MKIIIPIISVVILMAGFIFLGENNQKDTEKVVSISSDEMLDVNQDGVGERFAGGYVCEEDEDTATCRYNISLYDENQNEILSSFPIIPTRTYQVRDGVFEITDEFSMIAERDTQPRALDEIIPSRLGHYNYYGDMNGDGVQDLFTVFFLGAETHRGVAIDVENQKLLGCMSMIYFADKFVETDDGKLNYFFASGGEHGEGEWKDLNTDFFADEETCKEKLNNCKERYSKCEGISSGEEYCARMYEDCDFMYCQCS